MDNQSLATAEPVKTRFEVISVALIDDPQNAMRTDMSAENIDDLVRSIKQVGIIEPLVVKPVGERFEIVAGHRRITAAEAAGLTEVPCTVIEATVEQAEMMKIHENLYRVDVNPYDEAQHYARLIQVMKLSPMSIARITNRSEHYVKDRLHILDYEPELRTAVAEGRVNLTVAKELDRIKEPHKLREMLGYAVGHGVTAAVARRWVDEQMPRDETNAGLTPQVGDLGEITPASEQHSKCFYCLQEVRLFDAYNVYVHKACLDERQKVEVEPEPAQE